MTKITVDADSKAKFPTIFKNLKMRKLDKRHVNTPYSDKKKRLLDWRELERSPLTEKDNGYQKKN